MSPLQERTTKELILTTDVVLAWTNDDRTHPNEERTDELQKKQKYKQKNKKGAGS